MHTFIKVWPTLIAAIALAGCGAPDPPRPLAASGEESGLYKVQSYEALPPVVERNPADPSKSNVWLQFRLVLETKTTRLTLTCGQSRFDDSGAQTKSCGQGTLSPNERVWTRKGPSGESLYVYSNEAPQLKQTVSFWMIERRDAE